MIAAIDTENPDAVSVVGARVSYNALTADQTALVDNADKLAQAEKDLLKRLVSSTGETEKPPAKKKQAQGQ